MKKENLNLIAGFIIGITIAFGLNVMVLFVVVAVIAEVMGAILPIVEIIKISAQIALFGWGGMFVLLGIYSFYKLWKSELEKGMTTKPESTIVVEIVEEVR